MSTRRFAVAALLLSVSMSFAQEKTDNVNLVQTFFQDATITAHPYGEGFLQYSAYEGDFSALDLALQGAFPIAPKFQLGGGIGFRNYSVNNNSEGGISDLAVSGRYLVVSRPTAIAVGGLITLPIGSEDIDEGTFDFSFFGSLRHPLSSGLVITSSLALEFVESNRFGASSDYNNGVLLAGGLIIPVQSGLSLVTELNIRTEGDYILLSGGLDYAMKSGGRLRGALGLGLDDGAPNFALRGGYYFGF